MISSLKSTSVTSSRNMKGEHMVLKFLRTSICEIPYFYLFFSSLSEYFFQVFNAEIKVICDVIR